PRPARAPSRGNAWRLPMHNWRDAVTEAAAPPVPTREQEEEELSRLLALPEISRSANLVRLLSFICEKYFEGKTDEIRESAIAVQALGRKKDAFDSQADPIVRVTARTLRKRLEAYYQHDGRGHGAPLVLPTGQYVPRFVRSEDAHERGSSLPEHAADDDDAAPRGAAVPTIVSAPPAAPARAGGLRLIRPAALLVG